MIFGIDLRGIGWSVVAALGTGTAFTQDIPQGANGWWKFGTGLSVAVALQYMAWSKERPHRKTLWNEEERAQKMQGKE